MWKTQSPEVHISSTSRGGSNVRPAWARAQVWPNTIFFLFGKEKNVKQKNRRKSLCSLDHTAATPPLASPSSEKLRPPPRKSSTTCHWHHTTLATGRRYPLSLSARRRPLSSLTPCFQSQTRTCLVEDLILKHMIIDNLVNTQIANGVEGILIAGFTGEGQLMTWNEQIMIIARTVNSFGYKILRLKFCSSLL